MPFEISLVSQSVIVKWLKRAYTAKQKERKKERIQNARPNFLNNIKTNPTLS